MADERLPFTDSTAESHMAASKAMVDEADELYAVWDGTGLLMAVCRRLFTQCDESVNLLLNEDLRTDAACPGQRS
jgi:hypothetical protein